MNGDINGGVEGIAVESVDLESVDEVLRVTDLTKSYGGLKAMDGVSSVSYTHLTLPTILLV